MFATAMMIFGVVLATTESAPLSALVWWLIPLVAFIGAIAYVIWVSKFQAKFENETNRSVGRFQRFQQSLEGDRRFTSVQKVPANGSARDDHLSQSHHSSFSGQGSAHQASQGSQGSEINQNPSTTEINS
jgi:hypothetical protein